jgi:hypothetical protein
MVKTSAGFLVLLLAAAGCAPGQQWKQELALPDGALEVMDAAASLPECDGLREGGDIIWHAQEFPCLPRALLACGCTYVQARPRIEVTYRGAVEDSALPHELCHACGYVDELETDACAYRLRRLAGRPEPSTYSCARRH